LNVIKLSHFVSHGANDGDFVFFLSSNVLSNSGSLLYEGQHGSEGIMENVCFLKKNYEII